MKKVVASAWITLDGVFDAASMSEWFLPYHTDERGKIITDWIMTRAPRDTGFGRHFPSETSRNESCSAY